jgi:hypothetical protein
VYRPAVWGALLLYSGCPDMEPVSLNAAPGRTVSLETGQQLDLTLQTIGPGEYATPPELTGRSLKFVAMSYVSPAVPGGPTQRFRFEAVAPGQTVIVFRHTGLAPLVSDTVEVR